jgi:hypothetical protein
MVGLLPQIVHAICHKSLSSTLPELGIIGPLGSLMLQQEGSIFFNSHTYSAISSGAGLQAAVANENVLRTMDRCHGCRVWRVENEFSGPDSMPKHE